MRPPLAAITGLGLMVILAAGSIAGCGKKGESSGPGTTQGQLESGAPTTPGMAQSSTTNTAPDLAELTRELRRWILRNRRPPKDFADFAATASVPIPPAPAGKKYVIDKQMHVILVNQ